MLPPAFFVRADLVFAACGVLDVMLNACIKAIIAARSVGVCQCIEVAGREIEFAHEV